MSNAGEKQMGAGSDCCTSGREVEKLRDDLRAVSTRLDAVELGFPRNDIGVPDFDGHRRFHSKMIKDAETSDSDRREAVKKLTMSGVVGGLTIVVYALWDYLKAHLK